MHRRIRLDLILALVGVVLLGYVGETLVEARVREFFGGRRLERAWATAQRVAPLQSAAPRPTVGDLLGRLEIPRLGISALVAEGTDDGTLRTAIGHLPRTPLPGERGNVALAAHRDTHFRALRKIEVGDRIRIHSWEGETEYEVTATHIVAPQDVSVLAPTPGHHLTLITCYPFGYIGPAPKRFVVQARQTARGSAAGGVSSRPGLSGSAETRSSAADRRPAPAA